MLSFHDDQAIKDKYIARTDAHLLADELIQGKGWDGKKGCAVGCTLDKYDHSSYETELGLPEWLARLQDSLHEGQTLEDAQVFFKGFLRAIPVGKDLTLVKHKFCSYLMDENLKTLEEVAKTCDADNSPEVAKAIEQVKSCVQEVKSLHEKVISGGEWDESAARSAESAAEYAAWSAAWSAWSTARSTESAARSAAKSAESAARSAKSAAYKKHADKLLEFLREV